jgi:hypothetical protein
MALTQRDIRAMVAESLKKYLKENVENELTGWHGSVADFDKFDTSFIGTGESTQVYGWGIYITGVKETGHYYAALIAKSKHSKDKGNAAIAMNKKVEKSIKPPFKKLKRGEIDFEECKREVLANMQANGVSEFFINKYKQVKTMADSRAFGAMAVEIATRAYKRIVYTVEIPDEGFIDWNSTDTNLIQGIYKKFVEQFGRLDVNIGQIISFGQLYCQLAGGSRCKSLYKLEPDKTQLPPKDISKFLMSLGYKGISVPIGNKHGGDDLGYNYVIFNKNDIEIKKVESI